MRAIERSIEGAKEVEYLDACMSSHGYKTSNYCKYEVFNNMRFPSCYFSQKVFWAN